MDLRSRAQNLRQQQAPRTQMQPPKESGQRLATLERPPDEQIRIAWETFTPPDGPPRPYLSIRLWRRDSNGAWWPCKEKGISIRVRELADLADGVAQALDLAEELRAGQPAPGRRATTTAGLSDLPADLGR